MIIGLVVTNARLLTFLIGLAVQQDDSMRMKTG